MKDKLGTLTSAVSRYKSMEDVMQNTLIVAQSTSDEVKKAANTKAQAIVEEAETKAREILMDSKHQLSQINMELEQMKLVMAGYKNQMRSILQAGLEMIEKIPDAAPKTPQTEPPQMSAQPQEPQMPQQAPQAEPVSYYQAPPQGMQSTMAEQPFAATAAMAETEEERLRREETMLHIRQAMEQQRESGGSSGEIR